MVFFQNLINALQWGSFYALIALGYSMVYSILMLFNFAHGDMVAASAFVGLTIYTQVMGQATSLGAVIVIFLLTAAVMACVGVILERQQLGVARHARRSVAQRVTIDGRRDPLKVVAHPQRPVLVRRLHRASGQDRAVDGGLQVGHVRASVGDGWHGASMTSGATAPRPEAGLRWSGVR